MWHADYIHFKVRGMTRWMFGVPDAETKLIIAHDTAEDKFKYNATELFKDAIKAAGKRPDMLVTDGLCRIQDRIQKGNVHSLSAPRTTHAHMLAFKTGGRQTTSTSALTEEGYVIE